MDSAARPPLPDGLVAFVKRACPTCEVVAPVLAQLAREASLPLTVYTQDDPAFPAEVPHAARVDDRARTLRLRALRLLRLGFSRTGIARGARRIGAEHA